MISPGGRGLRRCGAEAARLDRAARIELLNFREPSRDRAVVALLT